MTLKDPQPRTMYSMPWLAENKTSSLSFLPDQQGVPILTVIPARYYTAPNMTASLDVLRNKIVVIGASYRDGHDVYLTPIGEMPGSLIIINAIHSLLQYGGISSLPSVGFMFLLEICLIIFMTAVLMMSRGFWTMLLSGTMVIFLLLPISIVSFAMGSG